MGAPCDKNGIPYVPSFDPNEAFEVTGKDGISVDKIQTGAKTIWEVGLYTAPSATMVNDSPIMEVGDTNALVEWTLNSGNGSVPIETRVLDPDEGLTGLVGAFQFQISDVASVIAGIVELHTLTVDDEEGPPVVVTSGVNFQFKVFQGFNGNDTLDETAIEALVNSSPQNGILDVYGGAQDYVIPFVNQYIYWVYPVGTVGISAAILNGLPLPIEVVLPAVSVTNVNGEDANYTVVRTSNRFGVGTLNITLS
jgi:hypothetical protein